MTTSARATAAGVRLGVAVLFLALAGCGGTPDAVTWRNIEFAVPDGWALLERTDTALRFATGALPDATGELATPVVLVDVVFDPLTGPDDWRRVLGDRGATVESDDAILVGGDVPARRFVHSSGVGVDGTRELVLLVPSRGIVLVARPLTGPGLAPGAEVLLDELDVVLAFATEAVYGAPVLE